MIRETWKRIAGMHVTKAGDMAFVWMALDPETDTLHIYDCAMFRKEPWPVIGEGVAARGRYITMVWVKGADAVAEELEKRGVQMLGKKYVLRDDEALAEMTAKSIESRMQTRRLKVNASCVEWQDEFNTYFRDETSVPRDSHPLMAATSHAVAQMNWARPLRRKARSPQRNAPKLAIV